jgi:outer membrane protein insertion porin family
MRRICTLLVIAVLAMLAITAHAQAPAQPVVKEITFQGIAHLDAPTVDSLKGKLKSQVGQPLSPETVTADKEMLTESGWFFRVDSRTEPVEGGVRLVFVVVENPVITAIDFIGNTAISDADLQKEIASKPGTVLNRAVVRVDATEKIRGAYVRQGYTLVEVTDINITREGKLEFTIFEPKIGEIRIEGNKKTRDYVVRRELEFKPGDLYNEKVIRRSLRNLEGLNIFQEVTAAPEPGDQPGTLIVVVRVTERRTGLASVGIGHSNIQGLIGFVDVADTNLFGSGQRLSARVQFGADSSYTLSYTNPYIDSRRTSFTANLYDRTILRQAVQLNTTYLYNEDRNGFNFTFGRPTGLNTRTYVTLRNDRVRAKPEDNNPVPAVLLQGADVRSVALSQVRDTRDSFLNPSAGLYTSIGAEYAGFGGADFQKFTGEGRTYRIVRQRVLSDKEKKAGKQAMPWVFASRLSAGATAGSPPFLDQFLVGGADTLRGFKEDRFPGESMVLLNNELRVPITDALQVVGFFDAGDAWRGDFAQQFGDGNLKLHYGYGAGIRIQTPIGPLRLDYGLNAEGGHEFHFGVGPTY